MKACHIVAKKQKNASLLNINMHMKLISLNIEGRKHLARVKDFLHNANADVICLQEAPSEFCGYLESMGLACAFLPMTLRKNSEGLHSEGLILASKQPATFESFYYYQPHEELRLFDKTNARDTCAQGAIAAKILSEGNEYTVATTHFTWTPNGSTANKAQIEDMDTLISRVALMPPHVMCGDFNIPRGFNPLYEKLVSIYTDAVPAHYASSLDKDLHRLGNDADKSILFDHFMVDYLFTQQHYTATDVSLEFGISDHAAVIATILPLPI